MAQRTGDMFAALFQRAGDAFRDLVDARGDRIRDQRDVLAQVDLHSGDGATHLFGLADQIIALMRDVLQQRANADFVVGIGALERSDFVRDQAFEFARACNRAFDAIAHRRDLAADRLADGDDEIARGNLRARRIAARPAPSIARSSAIPGRARPDRRGNRTAARARRTTPQGRQAPARRRCPGRSGPAARAGNSPSGSVRRQSRPRRRSPRRYRRCGSGDRAARPAAIARWFRGRRWPAGARGPFHRWVRKTADQRQFVVRESRCRNRASTANCLSAPRSDRGWRWACR